jgi:hypothetical protein
VLWGWGIRNFREFSAGIHSAWDLKEIFRYFWHYRSPIWAGAFLDYWCSRAMRSRPEPMKRVARMLRAHGPLILNWFGAKVEISTGAVEGLNNKIRMVTRQSYGFRTFEAMEVALYHTLGRLPEPESQILLRRAIFKRWFVHFSSCPLRWRGFFTDTGPGPHPAVAIRARQSIGHNSRISGKSDGQAPQKLDRPCDLDSAS